MSAAAVLVALALDVTLREPPPAVHPVRGIGRGLDRLALRVPAGPPALAVVVGGLAWAIGLAATTTAAVGLDRGLGRLPALLAAVGRGVALWPLLSLAMLVDEVAAVERALTAGHAAAGGRACHGGPGAAGELDAARVAVARIVSRDVSDADAIQVRTAAISSLAENVSDALVAPLLWFAVFGLPGAAAYRFVNTADAMWGYHNDRWDHAGRVAARSDDLANLLPARLTGVVLALGGPDLATLRREARRTPSPNGGWPMAAVALQLGIRCDKPGSYLLNAAGRPAQPGDTAHALRLVGGRALAIGGVLALAARMRASTSRWGRSRCRR